MSRAGRVGVGVRVRVGGVGVPGRNASDFTIVKRGPHVPAVSYRVKKHRGLALLVSANAPSSLLPANDSTAQQRTSTMVLLGCMFLCLFNVFF